MVLSPTEGAIAYVMLFEIKCFSNITPLVMSQISLKFVSGFVFYTHHQSLTYSNPVIHKTGKVTFTKANQMDGHVIFCCQEV